MKRILDLNIKGKVLSESANKLNQLKSKSRISSNNDRLLYEIVNQKLLKTIYGEKNFHIFINRQKKVKKISKMRGFFLFVNKGLSFQNRSMIN